MGEKPNIPPKTTTSPAEMLTGSGVAVESGQDHWYIAECKPTKERVIRTMLEKAHYEVYIASRTEEKVYANRTRHIKETILIPGKVFVRTQLSQLMPILVGYSTIHRFMINRASSTRTFAHVPEHEMKQLQYMLGAAENPVQITTADLKVDQQVKVMRGPLEGLIGWYYKEGHTSYVVIKVSMGSNNYVYTEIPLEDIQPL